jgi:hypothetical protein
MPSMEDLLEAFRLWIEEHAGDLASFRQHARGDLDDSIAANRPLRRLLFDGGWTRIGWPEACGGIGGTDVQRASVLEELSAAGYVVPEMHGVIEIISPMLIRYTPDLARAHVPAALAGDELWCQGFSEPEAGSDLGSLRTRALPTDTGFRLTGQKMWSSWGHVAQRCCVLARTGAADSGYRGLTMFWVDMDSPGVSTVPTMCANGRHEVAEIFFDDVVVPADRVIGDVNGGWAAVMYLMQFERGAFAWLRQADLHTDLQRLIEDAADWPDDANRLIGETYLALFALRSQCGLTIQRLAAGEELGPEISVDKLLLGAAEQVVADATRRLRWPALEIGDDEVAAAWREQWTFSRVTTIYGGAAEVHRDLVAERLLALPRSR